jgi:hypothetical protein
MGKSNHSIRQLLSPALLLCVCFSSTFFLPSAMAEEKARAPKIEIVGADTQNPDSEKVLDAFKKLMQGLEQRNTDQIASCLSSEVILFDNRSHNLVSGKDAVMNHINKNVLGTATAPAVTDLTVYNPFVAVKGDTAMVSFRAVKTLAGEKPTQLESWCSEIFEREESDWKVLYFKSSWKPLSHKT